MLLVGFRTFERGLRAPSTYPSRLSDPIAKPGADRLPGPTASRSRSQAGLGRSTRLDPGYGRAGDAPARGGRPEQLTELYECYFEAKTPA